MTSPRKYFSLLIFAATLSLTATAAQAQQTATATLHADGSQEIHRFDAAGKSTVVTVQPGNTMHSVLPSGSDPSVSPAATNQSHKIGFVRHEAVLNPNGTSEMHLFDASGRMTMLKPVIGESLQQTYWKYLAKEGMPCACEGGLQEPEAPAKTAILPAASRPQN